MFTVVNSSQSEHGLGVRDRWSRVGYRDYVSMLITLTRHMNAQEDSFSQRTPFVSCCVFDLDTGDSRNYTLFHCSAMKGLPQQLTDSVTGHVNMFELYRLIWLI